MTTAVAPSANGERKPSALATIKDALNHPQFKDAIAKALPAHMTADRFLRIATTATLRTPKLLQCTQPSLLNCLLQLSQYGLEPDGRRAHLIPFDNSKKVGNEWIKETECTLIIDYKGLVELVLRSGLVANLHADTICENDDFDYDKGFITRHKIDFKQPRGKVYAVYCVCRMKDGTEKSEVMTREDVETIRSRSKAGKNGPWVTDWNEMAKKTVFRRLSKWLPLSPEIRDAIDNDDDRLEEFPSSVIQGTARAAGQSKSDELAAMLADRGGNQFSDTGEESNEADPASGEESQVEPESLSDDLIIARLEERLSKANDGIAVKGVEAAAEAIGNDDLRKAFYDKCKARRAELANGGTKPTEKPSGTLV